MAASAPQGKSGSMSTVKLLPQSFPKYQGQESDLQAGWQAVKETRSSFKGWGLVASALPSHRSSRHQRAPRSQGFCVQTLGKSIIIH